MAVKHSIPFQVFFLALCICTIFVTSADLVSQEILPKWYTLYTLTLLGWCLFVLTAKSVQLNVDMITVVVLITIAYVLLCSPLLYAYAMSPAFQSIGFLFIFLLFKMTDKQDSIRPNCIIVGVCTIQAIYGILQFFDVFANNSSFAVVGSFDNPAGFAASLAYDTPYLLDNFLLN